MAALVVLAVASVSLAASAETVLHHVPQADLKVLDPVTNTAFITMQYSFMVYDQLFAVDGKFEPKPQMVESYKISGDNKYYTFTLRPGLSVRGAVSNGRPYREPQQRSR
jgi:peptide/nickel transport system substrate-binding protein